MEEVAHAIDEGKLSTEATEEVNNHVHTIYSFSPYSPAGAAYMAWQAGLKAIGIMDHDSVSGAGEMLDACRYIGMGSTVGFELRTNFTGTRLEGRTINSPDSKNIGYIAIHGIPVTEIEEARIFLEPLQQERNIRNKRIVENLNTLILSQGIKPLDFVTDVSPVSQAAKGGTITERHILYTLGLKLAENTGKGVSLVRFLEQNMGIPISGTIGEYLSDTENPHYFYDLLGVLKSSFLPRIFVQPDEKECIPVKKAVDFANSIGAIPAYAYLGDVTDSPTGDKKAQKFEDDYLDDVFDTIKELEFKAVTYMPPRNTREQLHRIQKMCGDYELMEISGVDINSSRQVFKCPIILEDDFKHLTDATWALIAHEKLAGQNKSLGLFNPRNPNAGIGLHERLSMYNKLGRRMDHHKPENVLKLI